MKFRTIIDKERDEEVLIYTHERTRRIKEIEEFVSEAGNELFGYKDKNAIKFPADEAECFTVEDGKVFALVAGEKLSMKQRLYMIEQQIGDGFVKINQSCIVRVNSIVRFDASFGGALIVTLKSGYKDYVSRRQLKTVKDKIGIK